MPTGLPQYTLLAALVGVVLHIFLVPTGLPQYTLLAALVGVVVVIDASLLLLLSSLL